jgi:hypothetical protein
LYRPLSSLRWMVALVGKTLVVAGAPQATHVSSANTPMLKF